LFADKYATFYAGDKGPEQANEIIVPFINNACDPLVEVGDFPFANYRLYL